MEGEGGGEGVGINGIMYGKEGRGVENQTFNAYILSGCPLVHVQEIVKDKEVDIFIFIDDKEEAIGKGLPYLNEYNYIGNETCLIFNIP